MRQPLTLLIAIFLSILSLSAQSFQGDWNGRLSLPGGSIRINIHLNNASGSWLGTLDSPDQGVNGMKMDNLLIEDDRISFEYRMYQVRYSGQMISPDSISGIFTQGGMTIPLSFHRSGDQKRRRVQDPQEPLPYQSVEFVCTGGSPEVKLAGTLTVPNKSENQRLPAIILISGSGPQNRDEELADHRPFAVIADHFTRQGCAVLRYDDRGTAESSGSFLSATTEDFARDTEAVLSYAKTLSSIDPKRIHLLGHSEGAMIAIMVASKHPDLASIILMCPPISKLSDIMTWQATEALRSSGSPQEQIDATIDLNQKLFKLAADRSISNDSLMTRARHIIEPFFLKLPGLSEPMRRQQIEATIRQIATPWTRTMTRLNPTTYLKKIRMPIRAAFGARDKQVPVSDAELLKHHYPKAKIRVFPNLNHLLQPATTGAVTEYSQIETTISPDALIWLSEL